VFGSSGRITDFYVINGGAVEIVDLTPTYTVQYRIMNGKEYVRGDTGFYKIFGGDVGVGPLAERWVLRPGDVYSIVAKLLANVSAEAGCVLGGRHFTLTGSQGDVRVYSDGVPTGAGLPLRLELPAAGPPLPRVIEQTAVADRSEPLCVRALGFTGDSVGGEHIRVVLDSYNAVPTIVAPTSAIDLTRPNS
jgi:hypothetical protein